MKKIFMLFIASLLVFLPGCLAKYEHYADSVQTINTADPRRIEEISKGITAITAAAVADISRGVEARPLSILKTAGTSEEDGAEVKVFAPVDSGAEWIARMKIAETMAAAFVSAIQSRPTGLSAPNDAGTVLNKVIDVAVPVAGIIGAAKIFSEGISGAGTMYSGAASNGGSIGGSGHEATSTTITKTVIPGGESTEE